MNIKQGSIRNPGNHELFFSFFSWIPGFLIVINFFSLFLIANSFAVSETKIYGYTGLSYTEISPGPNEERDWSQTLSLRWIDQLYKNKIDLGLDLLLLKSDSERHQLRPTWSANVRGYQYTLNTKYLEYRDPTYQGGQLTLVNINKNLNLTLTPPDLPRITISIFDVRAFDDQEIHSVNSFNERKTIRADYQLGNLAISAARTEYLVWNKPEVQNSQSLSGLVALSVDAIGYVYVISNVTYTVQVYTSGGSLVREWGGFGSGPGHFTDPVGIVVDNIGNVYVSDAQLNIIQKFSNTGQYLTQWGGFGSGNGRFNNPNGMAVDNDGYIYVVDKGNNRVQKFTSVGSFILSIGSSGSGNGQFNSPVGVAVDNNRRVYVTDAGNNRIQKFDSTGTYITQWGATGSDNGQFNLPTGITVSDQGYVYVLDYNNQRIQRFTTDGIFLNKWIAHGSQNGNSIALGPSVRIYEANISDGLVYIYSSDGAYLSNFGNFVTLTSNISRFKTTTNQLSLNYGLNLSEYFNFNFGYNITDTKRKGISIVTTDSKFQQYSFGWQVNPVDFASIYGNHSLVLTDMKINDRETQDISDRTNDVGLTLRPYENTNITFDLSRSTFIEDSTGNTRLDNESLNISSQLYPDLSLTMNQSHSETFNMDTETSISDLIGLTVSAQLIPEASADVYLNHNVSKNLLDDSKNTSDAIGLRLRSRPTEKMLWNETIQWSRNKDRTISDDTASELKSTQINYTTELNYLPRPSFNIFLNGTYTQNLNQTNNLNYTVGYTWRPKNTFYMTNSFSQTHGLTDSSTISSTLEFQFRYQVRLTLGGRWFDQENKEQIRTLFSQLTKTF